jgi:hypothetical protein
MNPHQIKIAMDTSRRFEQAWRINTHPATHSLEEIQEVSKFVLDNWENFEEVIFCPPDPGTWPPEVYDKIFAGLFHTNIRYPIRLPQGTLGKN